MLFPHQAASELSGVEHKRQVCAIEYTLLDAVFHGHELKPHEFGELRIDQMKIGMAGDATSRIECHRTTLLPFTNEPIQVAIIRARQCPVIWTNVQTLFELERHIQIFAMESRVFWEYWRPARSGSLRRRRMVIIEGRV